MKEVAGRTSTSCGPQAGRVFVTTDVDNKNYQCDKGLKTIFYELYWKYYLYNYYLPF